ncbi:UDP-N-acetylmuramoyl-L-alanyl-D-glutamate--2,6-diaminopimelate ligase [Moraxella nasibovis]|uniref:UDP-N-acetylmuramoyl-L-alanyl-D-glutamate--2, 6-diaminopimelate ligase n=1 Tax=Moraxella nasibovis TaxID=2904120 RepID=UPI00240EBDD5|nr:UDP-N-acetylmuramoyl-L-alanyl-D-glutamate--2,6-diaminopimelate ligase [Moraxella nasibovis]WFF39741.1 UDP-N-acetylmuramoyl-L-alanyl-D-glutamate--2,6-diaminopimelate ligase [Moraxella nasibovis]
MPDALMSVADVPFVRFCLDSRKIEAGDAFVLLESFGQKGDFERANGYLKAVADKAAFALSQIDPALLDTADFHHPIVYLPSIRECLGELIAARFQLENAAALPTVVAVTGTNGKTTISQLVAQLAELSGVSSAIMGTAGNGRLGQLVQSANTTGDVLLVQEFLYKMAQDGAELVSLEASSHGLHQHRLQGVPVKVAIYSNLSRDHLDYHSDMADYANAKAKLFDKALFPNLTHAIINLDDEYSEVFLNQAKASGLTVWTYSTSNAQADIFASDIAPSLDGVEMSIATPQGQMTVKSPLLGLFNVANLLASIGASLAMGISLEKISNNINHLKGASGRMERVPSKTGSFIVDYAHTPDALEQVLKSLKNHCAGSLIAVFGCGGDRDRGKRPLMTKSALKFADKVILTADNPRSENPLAILKDMQEGLDCESHYKIEIEPDRKLAIELAVKLAGEQDIVVIAGKGHETYQEIQGVRYDFDDRVVVGEMIGKWGK